MQPSFIPWLFDSREAWDKAIRDSRYHYSMPFNQFMQLYQSYRNGTPVTLNHFTPPTQVTPTTANFSSNSTISSSAPTSSSSSGAGQILDQSEIDALLASMNG
jgi:hypothetical protein